jgi:hypothetical protein
MICKCKNKMISAGSIVKEYDFSVEEEKFYWCKKCGRLVSEQGKLISCWYEHSLLPKPKIIERDPCDWCTCKKWKSSKPNVIAPDEDYCRYCGAKLQKTEVKEE